MLNDEGLTLQVMGLCKAVTIQAHRNGQALGANQVSIKIRDWSIKI